MKKPFFSQFIEAQDLSIEEINKVSGGRGDMVTMKAPSDDDEGDIFVTMKSPSDDDEGDFAVTMKYPSDGDDDILE